MKGAYGGVGDIVVWYSRDIVRVETTLVMEVEGVQLEVESNNESHRGAYITKITAASTADATLLVLRFGSNFYLLLWLCAVFISIFLCVVLFFWALGFRLWVFRCFCFLLMCQKSEPCSAANSWNVMPKVVSLPVFFSTFLPLFFRGFPLVFLLILVELPLVMLLFLLFRFPFVCRMRMLCMFARIWIWNPPLCRLALLPLAGSSHPC